MVDCAAANLGSTPVRRVRLLLLVPATALAVAACGSSSTTGSGTPAGSSRAGSSSPGPAATTSPAPADNGVSALSAEQILARAKSALGAADAVHISGTGKDANTTAKIDMRYGDDVAAGSFVINGQRLELLRVIDDVYVKGSTSFWTTFADASVAKLLGGKYVKTSVSDPRFKELAEITDLTSAAEGFLEPDGTITKGKATTVAGQPAIALVVKSATGGTLYIATTGRPYPLSIEDDPGSTGSKLTFTDYGKQLKVKAPPASQVVDASTLPGS
jgi:hypothetical protein